MSLEKDIENAYKRMEKREPVSRQEIEQLKKRLVESKEPISAEKENSLHRKMGILTEFVSED